MRALVLDNATRKELDSLPDKHFRQVITAVFSLLKEPRPADSRLLSGFPFYRISVGEYRVVYDYTDDQVRIVAFGKRNDDEVYRMLRRRQ
jgi:mRNA interferase RelE/StbE